MLITTFTQLRNEGKKYFDAVENGETVEIYRHGKPVAILSPIQNKSMSRWKKADPIKISGVSLSNVILQQRDEEI